MNIKKKPREELTQKTQEFLESLTQTEQIDQKTSDKILKSLNMDKGFLSWLMKKTEVGVDIHDKKSIEKALNKILSKGGIGFDDVRDKYMQYQKSKKMEQLAVKKTKEFFEPYMTSDEIENERAINAIKSTIQEPEEIEKIRLFLDMLKKTDNEANIQDNRRNRYVKENFLEKYAKERNIEDLRFVLNIEDINLSYFGKIQDALNQDICKTLRLLSEKFNIRSIKEIDRYTGEEWYEPLEKILQVSYKTIKENLEALEKEQFKFNENNKEVIKMIIKNNLKEYMEFLKDAKMDREKKTKILENISNLELKEIKEFMDIVPDNHYEGNGNYTQKTVKMFGGDRGNDKRVEEKIREIFRRSYVSEEAIKSLVDIRTSKRTKNRRNNVNYTKELGAINSTIVMSFGEVIQSKNGSRNCIISELKTVPHEEFRAIIKKMKEIGMITKEETKKGIETVLYYGKVQETISALNILIDDIGIKDIKKILEIRDSYDRSDVYPMFDSNRDRKNEHEERKEKIAILKANGITATEDLTKLIKTICVSDMGYLKKILEKYKNITVQQLLSITRILSRPKELDIIFKKYPEISLEDLARIDQTIGKIYDEDERKKIIEQLDIYDEDVEEAAKLFHIIRNYLESETIKEIFDDMEPKDRINEKNRIAATVIYSIISRLPNTTIHDEIKKTINNLFGQEEKENKDFIYENIRRILEKTIEKGNKITNKERILIDAIEKRGMTNLPFIENINRFTYEIRELPSKEKTTERTKTNIYEKTKAFLKKQRKRSNADMNNFYYVAAHILKIAPSLYDKMLGIFEQLKPNDTKYFYEKIFPLYQTELALIDERGKYKVRDLAVMHENMKEIIQKLEKSNDDKKSVLEEENNRLTENIKNIFKKKFGIKKIPDEINEQHIESIKNHSIFLANMAEKTEEKKAVLGFFLALKLNGKRESFRSGEKIDLKEYMNEEHAKIIEEYLKKREENDVLKDFNRIDENKHKKALQESEITDIFGSTESIGNRLLTIKANIKSLLDPDIYEEKEKILLNFIQEEGEILPILGKKYKEIIGTGKLSIQEMRSIEKLEEQLGKKIDQDEIKNIQGLMKGISPIINFVKKVENMEINREIEEFESIKIPEKELIEIFNKVGANFGSQDGVMGVRNHVASLMMKIEKDTNNLSKQEKKIANEYLDRIRKELQDMYDIMKQVENLYDNFYEQIGKSKNQRLKDKIEKINDAFQKQVEEGKKEHITSFMTNDLDIVIKNIRECLSCKTAQCNNDTNLSFGVNNRFLITTSDDHKSKGSYSDELVTLLPSQEGLVFVMDKVYGRQAADILACNTLAVIQKIKKIGGGIGILLNENALKECNLDKNYLLRKLAENGIKNFTIEEKRNIMVNVPIQPIGDSHYEFGDIGPRGSGNALTSGILVHLN